MLFQIKASVIIPAYNQAAYLSKCLSALAAQTLDPSSFEIIVVDNNSTDNTRTVAQEFARAYPFESFRYVQEKMQGASYARNRGITEAKGEIVCFLDQDSPPSPEWLAAHLSAFLDPHVGCTGGPSLPDFQGQEIPPWLQGDLQGLLSGYTLPFTEATAVSRWDQYPLTCNMAVRRELFDQLGPFRVDLDRIPGQLLAAGDTEMADRIQKAGWKVLYLPHATVRHFVGPERLTKEHIYERGAGLAATHIILTKDRNPRKILRWFASDLWYAFRMFCVFVAALVRRKPLWYDDYMRFWMVGLRIPMRIKSLFQGIVNNGRLKVDKKTAINDLPMKKDSV